MFACSQQPTVSREVRFILATDLAASWCASAMTSRLGMSEATMRRRLAAEGWTFSELLIDVRVSRALTLLQVTDRPVGKSPSASATKARHVLLSGFASASASLQEMSAPQLAAIPEKRS